MLTFERTRWWRVLLAAACVLAAPAGRDALANPSPTGAAVAAGVPVRGLIVRLRDAPDHAVAAHDASALSIGNADTGTGTGTGTTVTTSTTGDRRTLAVARSDARWRTLLASSGLGREPGLRLEAVGRNAWRVVFDRGRSPAVVAKWVTALAHSTDVQWVVPNERETALQAVVPNDPAFGGLAGQWWLLPASGSDANALDARLRGVPGFQTAWSRTTGSASVVIAVLDSGLAAHPDFDTRRILPGYDMVSDWDAVDGRGYANDGDGRDGDPTDPGDWVDDADRTVDPVRYGGCALQASDWHGTAVAGIVAAATDNAIGVAAATWASRMLPVRVAGKCGAEVADIVDGMRWAAGLQVCKTYVGSSDASQGCAQWAPINPTPARIVNISFGGTAACNSAYQDAVDELHGLGVVVVAAAGNRRGEPTRPASCNGVVGVAALNRDGFKTTYSNFGSAIRIATVGGDDAEGAWGSLLTDGGVQTLGNDGATTAGAGTYPVHFGTSFAAPIVSAATALMLSVDPSLTVDQVIAGLQASARPHVSSPLLPTCSPASPGRCICTTATCGAGILDADQAVAYAQAHAQGVAYARPNWAQQVIAGPEEREAVALGPDVAGNGDSSAGATTGSTGASGSGGGAVEPWGLLALAGCAGLLKKRRPRG